MKKLFFVAAFFGLIGFMLTAADVSSDLKLHLVGINNCSSQDVTLGEDKTKISPMRQQVLFAAIPFVSWHATFFEEINTRKPFIPANLLKVTVGKKAWGLWSNDTAIFYAKIHKDGRKEFIGELFRIIAKKNLSSVASQKIRNFLLSIDSQFSLELTEVGK